MKIGLVGLGKMGLQIATKLVAAGHEVVAIDVTEVNRIAAANAGATIAQTREEMLTQLPTPAVVWLMIPSQFVQSEIDEWLNILPNESILIDGGNSDFRLTKARGEQAKAKSISFIDIGTSGGILGLENGFSMMIGGNGDSVAHIDPILEALGQKDGYKHFGPSGAGHYIKMVHNAIEYGVMESYAEGYNMLKNGPFPGLDLGAIGEVWQHGSIIASDLNGLTKDALIENPELEGIEGYVSESGEAKWALEVAREHDVPAPSIQSSLDVRIASQRGEINFATKLLAAMRNKFGGHSLNK